MTGREAEDYRRGKGYDSRSAVAKALGVSESWVVTNEYRMRHEQVSGTYEQLLVEVLEGGC